MYTLRTKFPNILKFIWVLPIFSPIHCEIHDGSMCESTVEFLDCSEDLESILVISRRFQNTFRVKYTPGENCKFKNFEYNWGVAFPNDSLKIYDEYSKKKYTFVLEPFTVTYSDKPYFILFVAHEYYTNKKDVGEIQAVCNFQVSRENPRPVIKGGSEITVDSGKDVTVNADNSIDMEVPNGHKGHLQFKWSCTVNEQSLSDLCDKDLGTSSIAKIPARYAIDGLTYTFTLNVKSRESDWLSMNQIIYIIRGASFIEIICLKNCPPVVPATNAKEVTILEAKCITNCVNINPHSYDWKIRNGSSYGTYSRYEEEGSIFPISGGSWQEGQMYEISVKISNEQGSMIGKAAKQIKVHKPPAFEDCSIQPEQGEPLKTLFRVSCVYQKGVYTFEVYSAKDTSETLLERSTRLGNIEFILSAGSNVMIKMIDVYEYTAIYFLTVEVADTLDPGNKSLTWTLNKRYYDEKSPLSIDNLLKDENYNKLIQVLNVMADELEQLAENENFAKTASTYNNKLLTALKLIPLDNKEICKQVTAIAIKTSEKNNTRQNPNVAAKATDVCLKAAKKTLEYFNKVQHIGSFAEEIIEDGGLFADCAQVGLSTNPDVLKPKYNLPAMTTPYPMLTFLSITEQYPDYIDDDIISRNKKKDSSRLYEFTRTNMKLILDPLKDLMNTNIQDYIIIEAELKLMKLTTFARASQNLIDLCLVNAELLVKTLSPYQDGIHIKQNLVDLIAMKKRGKDLETSSITSYGAELRPSKDLVEYKEVDIFMCATASNPFLSISKETIYSSIAIVRFRSKDVISSFQHPFTISFNYTDDKTKYTIHKGLSLRRAGPTKSKQDEKFESMTMFRINVFRNQSYFIELTEFSNVLNFYVTEFRKPTPTEFRSKCIEVTEAPYRVFIENNKDYDRWDYLTITPKISAKVQVSFQFKVYTYACYRWKSSTRAWVYACGSSENSDGNNIACVCYHSSVLSARMKNNPVREEHTLYIHHKLEVQASYVIFLSVLVVWILYCAFLTVFSFMKDQDKQEIYFLSDIPSFYRFGYLVIVKTGSTGTTSNVMVKIYGTNTESKEHVLNFPDPDKKILQKGQEDWFFFATQYYLGDIEKIDIWFDSVGYRPSWDCVEIEVVDLQQEKSWLFQIKFKFEIKEFERHMLTVKPINKKNLTKRKIFCEKIKTGFQGPHLWNIFYRETSLSDIERLTIMFSILMTKYSITLLFYGLPAFKLTDGLGYYYEYRFDSKIVWTTFAASVITFLIHYPIVYLLRSVLISLIALSLMMTLLFGFWVPHVTSLMWLTTSFASLLVYIFLLENIVRLTNGFLQKGNIRIKKIFSKSSSILQYIESQRSTFYNMFGRLSMRPYFKKVYKPLNKDMVEERKHWAREKEILIETFEDIVMVGLYVFLLYIILVKDKDSMANISNAEIRDLVKGHHIQMISENILSRKEIENYMQDTIIPTMQSQQWYDRYIKKDPGCIIDNSNKYIGVARLRQHRADNTSCKIPSTMKFASEKCVSAFSVGPEYKSFSQKWRDMKEFDSFARLENIWKYQRVSETGTLGYTGTFAVYPGGGFVAHLGRTIRNSIINARYLIRNFWIDDRTRCLFIEFLTYNVNSNLFNNVKVIFEISPTGYISFDYKVQTAKLLLVGEETNVFTWIILLLFTFIVIALSIRLINTVRRQKRMAFKDFWRLVDIVIITITLICLFLYIKRSQAVGEFLEKVRKAKHNEFINHFHLFYAEAAFTSLAAILVFLATFRLWKLLRFLIIIKIVEKTLAIAAIHLFCIFIIHLHLLLVFATAGYLLFGRQSYVFETFSETVMNLILISLGFLNFEFESFASPLFYAFFCLYMITSLIILTVYIALITIHYGEAQRFYSDHNEYNVFGYIKEQCFYYKELAKVRFKKCHLKGGQDEDVDKGKHVHPKSDEHRYAKCLTLEEGKIKAMRLIALDCIRNMKPKPGFTNKDAELVKETIVQVFKTDKDEEKAFFFLSNLKGWKTTLTDDKRLLKMERILNILLSTQIETNKSGVYRNVVDNNDILLNRILKNLNIVSKGLNCIEINE